MAMIPGTIACTTGLAQYIFVELSHVSAAMGGVDSADSQLKLRTYSLAIATAVVSYLKANAVVAPTALLAPPGTAGGPVTGTGTIL